MPVPNASIPTPHRLLRSGLVCLLFLSTTVFARGPEAPIRIPLENFGFQPLPAQFLLNGSSMLTLHYVDDKHLLLTFVTHRLIPRLPDEPKDDQDRIVDAVLLEIPSGRILARTSWHLHDHAQYLWNLGRGHFLLRVRDTLTTFAPLANLATSEPFVQQPFLTSGGRRFAALLLSPEADLLIAETVGRTPPDPMQKSPLFGATPTPKLEERDLVQIKFYRLHPEDGGGPVLVSFAGGVQSRDTGEIPATTAGYLAIVDQGHRHWAFDFHSYDGKVAELSPFDSTCSPAPIFVSHSEFVAFGCRTSQTMQQIGGFNMRGEEMWEQGLFGDYTAPSFTFAPAGGRFALSRVMLRNSAIPDQPISTDEVSAQTVVVYQTDSGKQLLRVDCSPVERAGQNFALSPNGLGLAVVHADAIEIYNLPPLTDKDAAALKLAQASAPSENNLPVRFTSQTTSPTDSDVDPDFAAVPPNPQQPTTPAAANAALSSQPVTTNTEAQSSATGSSTPTNHPSGDTAPEQHRTPPTLYTLPTDKPPSTPKEPQQ